jgi:putative ATPase
MLVDLTELDSALVARLRAAEETMYQTPTDPLVNWDVPDLEAALVAVGFTLVSALQCDTQVEERCITAAHLERWLTESIDRQRPSYASRLLTQLTAAELQQVAGCMRRQLLDHIVPWQTRLVYITAVSSPPPLATRSTVKEVDSLGLLVLNRPGSEGR